MPSNTISVANITPAIGALKVAAIPPAAPAAISSFILFPETLKSCPIREPMLPPIWAIGPSTPAEPPEPMVRLGAMILMIIVLSLKTPS